jgi:hypothetical protein
MAEYLRYFYSFVDSAEKPLTSQFHPRWRYQKRKSKRAKQGSSAESFVER